MRIATKCPHGPNRFHSATNINPYLLIHQAPTDPPPPPPSSPLHRAPSPPSLSTVSFLYPFLISSIPLESLSSSWPLPSLSRSHPIQTILTIQCIRPIMAPLIPILTVRWWSHLNLGGIPVPSKLVTTLAALLLNSLVH